jgi:hypothetical protein
MAQINRCQPVNARHLESVKSHVLSVGEKKEMEITTMCVETEKPEEIRSAGIRLNCEVEASTRGF